MKKITELLKSGRFFMLFLLFIALISSDCNKENPEPLIEEIIEPEPVEISISPKEYSFKANTCSYENSIDSIMIENIDSLVNLELRIEYSPVSDWLLAEIDTITGKVELQTNFENKIYVPGNYTAKITLDAVNAKEEKTIDIELALAFTEEGTGKILFVFDVQGVIPNGLIIPYNYTRTYRINNGPLLGETISDLAFSINNSNLKHLFCWQAGDYVLVFHDKDNCRIIGQKRFDFSFKENDTKVININLECS